MRIIQPAYLIITLVATFCFSDSYSMAAHLTKIRTHATDFMAPYQPYINKHRTELAFGAGITASLAVYLLYTQYQKRSFASQVIGSSHENGARRRKTIQGYTGAYSDFPDCLLTAVTPSASNLRLAQTALIAIPLQLADRKTAPATDVIMVSGDPAVNNIRQDLGQIIQDHLNEQQVRAQGAPPDNGAVNDNGVGLAPAIPTATQPPAEAPTILPTQNAESSMQASLRGEAVDNGVGLGLAVPAVIQPPADAPTILPPQSAASPEQPDTARKTIETELINQAKPKRSQDILIVRYADGTIEYHLHPSDLQTLNALSRRQVAQLYELHNIQQANHTNVPAILYGRANIVHVPQILLPRSVWDNLQNYHKNRLVNPDLLFVQTSRRMANKAAQLAVLTVGIYLLVSLLKKINNAGHAALIATGKTCEGLTSWL